MLPVGWCNLMFNLFNFLSNNQTECWWMLDVEAGDGVRCVSLPVGSVSSHDVVDC